MHVRQGVRELNKGFRQAYCKVGFFVVIYAILNFLYMKSLGINWFIEGSIDFEQKKYILLDYLQEINRHFDRSKLYPNLTDLIFHYNNLLDFKRNKTILQQAFPQQMT